MNTTYRMKESPTTGTLEPVSVWKTPRFQRFIAITLGTGLLLSLIAASNLSADIDDLTGAKIPFIQSQLAGLQGSSF